MKITIKMLALATESSQRSSPVFSILLLLPPNLEGCADSQPTTLPKAVVFNREAEGRGAGSRFFSLTL